MNEFLKLALDQRKIKQILSLIFVGSISSFLFERLFFEYSLADLSDYKNIYSFFIYGHFIVPFSLFYFIWIFTIGLRMLLFELPNVFITRKFGSQIKKFLIWYYASDDGKYNSRIVLPESKSLDWAIKSTQEKNVEEGNLIRRALQSHRALESDYTLLLRALIAITIYFKHLEYFGWITYVICILILIFMWILQVVKYQFAEAAPYIIAYNKQKLKTVDSTESLE